MLHPTQHFTWCTLHISQISRVTIHSLDVLDFEPVFCSMAISNSCFLTCLQVPQGSGKVFFYSYPFKIFPQCIVIYKIKNFRVVNQAEVNALLEFSWFSCAPIDVGNLISGSPAFSKASLYIWTLSVHLLLKASLKNFEHYFPCMWNECNCAVVWTFLALAIFGIGMKTDFFQSCGHWWVFQISWHIKCSTLTASSFRILNNLT